MVADGHDDQACALGPPLISAVINPSIDEAMRRVVKMRKNHDAQRHHGAVGTKKKLTTPSLRFRESQGNPGAHDVVINWVAESGTHAYQQPRH